MSQAKYERLKEDASSIRHRHIYIQVCLLVLLCAISSVAVFLTWTVIYRKQANVPNLQNYIPDQWPKRALKYARILNDPHHQLADAYLSRHNSTDPHHATTVKRFENELIQPSPFGNFIYKTKDTERTKLVCYYLASSSPTPPANNNLLPSDINPHLCTHINVGMVWIQDNELLVDQTVGQALQSVCDLKAENPRLKVLVWVGGAEATGFEQMVSNHANRMQFIRSLKRTLEQFHLDGVDLDWEFPTSSDRQRQHLSQLLHEIRREYQRERRTYLLSLATAAPEGIVYFAYDVVEINQYVDYINVMAYDFHAYSEWTPFTGLNAPLYKRPSESSYLTTLNINASAFYWHSQGMDKSKIVIGLPTYGHSFKLVNSFNTGIMSPASGNGDLGINGFVTYSDVCWFQRNNYFVQTTFDTSACSPYMSAEKEWLSYENEQSIGCKANYIKANGFGGAMIFSLNTDDYRGSCDNENKVRTRFPLVQTVHSILLAADTK